MLILKSFLFEKFPEIIFGFSTKIGENKKPPYYFNLSLSVGDEEKIVNKNRENFFNKLGLKSENVAFQKQVHGNEISFVTKGGISGESDALITDKRNLGLAISTADCVPVFIFDKKNKIIAGVHSGWRGTEKKILVKVLNKFKNDFNSSSDNLIVYIGPSISQKNYEVGEEVAEKFDKKYLIPKSGKYLLNVAGINYDFLLDFGVPKENIQISSLCSFDAKNLLHSYRRDGIKSGRALGVIAMK